jgi:hypothetical protein
MGGGQIQPLLLDLSKGKEEGKTKEERAEENQAEMQVV